MNSLYTCSAVKKLMKAYINHGGHITTIEEGVLGYGVCILHGDGLYTTIVREVSINEWSSGHTVRSYKKCPKKYLAYIG